MKRERIRVSNLEFSEKMRVPSLHSFDGYEILTFPNQLTSYKKRFLALYNDLLLTLYSLDTCKQYQARFYSNAKKRRNSFISGKVDHIKQAKNAF